MFLNLDGRPVIWTRFVKGDRVQIVGGQYSGQSGVIEKFNGYWATDRWSAQVRLHDSQSTVRVNDMSMKKDG